MKCGIAVWTNARHQCVQAFGFCLHSVIKQKEWGLYLVDTLWSYVVCPNFSPVKPVLTILTECSFQLLFFLSLSLSLTLRSIQQALITMVCCRPTSEGMGSVSAGHIANGAVLCGGNRTSSGGKQERVVRADCNLSWSVTGIREWGAEINAVAVHSAFSLQWLSFLVQS